jgi:hypothetical protein
MDAATPSRVAGLDWASRRHAVCVLDSDGQVRARFDVPIPAPSCGGWARRLVRLGVPRSRSSDPTVQSWRRWWPLGWRSS